MPAESNTTNNCSSGVSVTVSADSQGAPDLVVYSPSVYDKVFDPGERFNMAFWVRNEGDGASTATATLKYYRSSDSTISSSDTELTIQSGTTGVGTIAASERQTVSVSLNAHSSGVYYYGACVGTVPNESNTSNNCAAVFRVTLTASTAPDLSGGVGVSQRQQLGDRRHLHVQRHRAQSGRRHGWVHHPALPPLHRPPPSPAATPRSAPTAW